MRTILNGKAALLAGAIVVTAGWGLPSALQAEESKRECKASQVVKGPVYQSGSKPDVKPVKGTNHVVRRSPIVFDGYVIGSRVQVYHANGKLLSWQMFDANGTLFASGKEQELNVGANLTPQIDAHDALLNKACPTKKVQPKKGPTIGPLTGPPGGHDIGIVAKIVQVDQWGDGRTPVVIITDR